MNYPTHSLPELEVSSYLLPESLQIILHTLLFIRAPGPVRPSTIHCTNLSLSYTRISNVPDLDSQISSLLTSVQTKLQPVGPELTKATISVSFYDLRSTSSLFGLVSGTEKVYWEKWSLPLLVNLTPRATSVDAPSRCERERVREAAEIGVGNVCRCIRDVVGNDIEHVPPIMYHFQMEVVEEKEGREGVKERLGGMPVLINTG